VAGVSGANVLLDRDHGLAPGDGLSFPAPGGRISGTLVNAVEGRRIEVQCPAGLKKGQVVFRSFDHAWHKRLRGAAVERRIGVGARLDFPGGRPRLSLRDEDGCCAEAVLDECCGPPQKPGLFEKEAGDALSRLGDTPFGLAECAIDPTGFVPLGRLNALRRLAAALLVQERLAAHTREGRRRQCPRRAAPFLGKALGHEWNVSNGLAKAFYERHGAKSVEPAFELQAPHRGTDGRPCPAVMTTRLCLKYEFGWCQKHGDGRPPKRAADPGARLYLKNGPTTLMCEFDCEMCAMRLKIAPGAGRL